ncbi:hypothetical protein [Poseidonibacter sp.]|uniref:hypothetical protein n=1 Tax=Poseidonibacter sp. TaxID=2321188 RepID=UPI003C759C81
MFSSNINELNLKALFSQNNSITKNSGFLQTINNINSNDEKKLRTDALTFENIKGISLEEIDEIFKDEEKNSLAKNLRIATLFSDDDYLGQAMFNTVLGQPFNLGYSYLFDRYEDKHSFFSSGKNNSLTDLLHKTMTNKLDIGDKKPTDVISQDRLDEILTQVNSFNFIDALSTTSKDQYGRYKDKDDDYSFLYNDYALQYEQLKFKYEELENINKNLIKQF